MSRLGKYMQEERESFVDWIWGVTISTAIRQQHAKTSICKFRIWLQYGAPFETRDHAIMDKPKIELSSEGLLSCRGDRPPPPAARMPQSILEMEDAGSGECRRDPEVRNLFLGISIAALCALVFVAALFLAGPEAPIVAAGSAAVSMIVLWLMSRMGVHRQPGGLFLSATVGGFVAMFVPLAAGLVDFLHSEQIERRINLAQSDAPQPSSTPELLPRLTESFVIESPDANKDDYARVIRNTTVAIEGKNYRIAIGELFPLFRVAEGEVIVKGRDFLISLPPDILQVVRKERSTENDSGSVSATAKSTPTGETETKDDFTAVDRAEMTRNAQTEAIKHYPALGIRDTAENRAFLDTYKRLKLSDSDLLKDPEWPLQLAEALAEREGWRRADIAAVSPLPGAVVAAAGITAETTTKNSSEFPPFDPTPSLSDEFGESMPLPMP